MGQTPRLARFFLITFFLITIVAFVQSAFSADWSQWRGPHRDGISSETSLLKEWPKDGPKLVWKLADVGQGYSTPAVVKDRIYLLGNEGLENEFVQALSSKNGTRAWRTHLGNVGNPKQEPSFPAARSTPTVEGEFLYALGSDGDLACVQLDSGKVRWQKSLRTDFGGKPGVWAYSESPLIDGDVLVCTPGGAEATLLALNKKTGEVIWKCAVPDGDDAAYASPLAIDAAGVKQYIQVLKGGLVGVDAKSGKLLWRYKKMVSRYGANIPTPIVRGNMIYSAGAGTGGGLVKLTPKDGGIEAEEVYFSPKLPAAIGGDVLLGDYVYGTGQTMLCFEFATGNIKWDDRALGAASLVYAGDRLYLHGENGEVALIEPSNEGFHEKGRFTPPDQPKRKGQMEKAWTYPVVADARLYIRDHQMLWCYDVSAATK